MVEFKILALPLLGVLEHMGFRCLVSENGNDE
jgi:hypothetical protein